MKTNMVVLSAALALTLVGCNCGTPNGNDGGTGGGTGNTTGGGTGTTQNTKSAGTPATSQPANAYGNGIGLGVDSNDLPVVAFYSFDQNGDDDYADSVVLFTRYNATTKAFNAPTTAVSGVGDCRKLQIQVQIEGDTIAIAFAKDDATSHVRSLWLAVSTNGGSTWSSSKINETDDVYGYSAFGMHAGIAHVFFNTGEYIGYRTGAVTADASTWGATTQLPRTANTSVSSGGRLSAVVDSSGTAHVVFGVADGSGHLVYQYFKPGMLEPSNIVSTGTQNDSWGVALNVFGTTLRVAAHYYVSGTSDVIRVSSSVDGSTWTAPLEVPNDGGQSPGDRMAMATGSLGQTAISYEVAGGNLNGTQCSEPKLARSIAFTGFTTCSPDNVAFSADYPALAFTSTNKLLFAFQNSSASEAANGVYVYLEP
jgi:hypothetical protein